MSIKAPRRFILPFWFRRILAVAVAPVGVVTAGLSALVLENKIPKGGWLWAWLIALAILLVVSVLLAFDKKNAGTLYYMRVLDERVPDVHQEARQWAVDRKYLSWRAVTRAITIGREPWVDVSSTVEQVRSELQRCADSDDPNTSNTLAPNAHWPIEFAIGFDWPLPDGAKIIELMGEGKKRPSECSADKVKFGFFRRGVNEGKKRPIECSADPEKADGVKEAASRNSQFELVWVDVHLTTRTVDENHITRWKYAVEEIFGRAPDATDRWGRGGWCEEGEVPPPCEVGDSDGQLGANVAAEIVAKAILGALDAHPKAIIAVSVSAPKAVAVLAGRCFAGHLQRKPQKSDNRTDPWGRLVLLAPNKLTGGLNALRVHHRQLSASPFR